MADSAISCGNNVEDLLHLLAKLVVVDKSDGTFWIRTNMKCHDCEDIESAINCGDPSQPEAILKKAFYLDCENDHLIINISYDCGET